MYTLSIFCITPSVLAIATLRLKEIDIFDGSLLVAAYPLRCMGGYGEGGGGGIRLRKSVEKELL